MAVPEPASASAAEQPSCGTAAQVSGDVQGPGPGSSLAADIVAQLLQAPARRRGPKSAGARTEWCCGGGTEDGRCRYYYSSAAAAQQPQLYTFEQAPPVLRFNRFIRSGYRAGLSYRQCLCSLLQLHNETGNIWLHLAPALAMLTALAAGLWQPWHAAPLAWAWNVASIWLCFALSACYHTFMANHHTYQRWLQLDVCGILLVLVGNGHVVVWWGLHCQAAWLKTFLTAFYFTAGAAAVVAALRARSALQRALPLTVLLFLRLVVLAVRLVAGGVVPALWHYALMELCSLAGGLLNALRIPERWLQPSKPDQPAALDLWLNSHAIMHVLVGLAMLELHLGAAADLQSMGSSALPCAVQ